MKLLKFIFPIFALFVFFACSEDVSTIDKDVIAQEPSQEEIDELIARNKADFEALTLSQFGTNVIITADNTVDTKELTLKSLSNVTRLKSATSGPVVYGPYTGTISEEKILTNYKMYVGDQPGLATGIYFCDIYRYYKEITLPTTVTAGWANYVTPEGFSNYSSQTPGYGFTQASGSSILMIYTYKIHVRYNILGSAVNKVYPAVLNNVSSVNYSYSYLVQ